jgi:hypothetical protein
VPSLMEFPGRFCLRLNRVIFFHLRLDLLALPPSPVLYSTVDGGKVMEGHDFA